MAGALFSRDKWRRFRNRFNDLRKCALLNYSQYRQLPDDVNTESNTFRFIGEIESITDGHTLWVRGKDLTIPVSLDKTKCFLLPQQEDSLHGSFASQGVPETPAQIRWNTICTLTEGAKVFIGGQLKMKNNRLSFYSSKENPLMVIFYNCPDDDLPRRIISGARTRWEYWNTVTPISLAAGALSLVYIAASLLERPAFHLTVITAIIAVFIPILPIIPPGILLTALYQRFMLNATTLRAKWDLAKFGLLPDAHIQPSRRFDIRAYSLEALAWIMLLAGILINIIFIFLILFQFKVITL
ncbi:MAG: hypothetical protein FWB73_00835 [Treponema sp.]|nr:hypothetical protein [Treponema sp.]